MNFTKKSLPVKLPKFRNAKNKNKLHDFPVMMKDRLKRQIIKINKALSDDKKNKEKRKLTKTFDFYYKEFEKLLSNSKVNKFSYSQFGKGLLCSVYHQRMIRTHLKKASKCSWLCCRSVIKR